MNKFALFVVLFAASVLFLVGESVFASGDHSDFTYTLQSDPSAGYWDRFGRAHPSFHGRSQCEPASSGSYSYVPPCSYGPGDFAFDFYSGEGVAQRFQDYPFGSSNWTARVWSIQPTCSAGPSAGGYTVFVDVYVGSVWEGWVAYGHLNSVSVSPGQTVGGGTILGYQHMWPYSGGCWEVTSQSGIHTHIEMYNAYRYACYYNYSSGTWLPYPYITGNIGRTIYTHIRSAC